MPVRAFFQRLSRRIHHRPWLRNTLGFSLLIAGAVGPVLPVLGIWMLPLGLFLLSTDFPWARRWHGWVDARVRRWAHRRPAAATVDATPLRSRRRPGDGR